MATAIRVSDAYAPDARSQHGLMYAAKEPAQTGCSVFEHCNKAMYWSGSNALLADDLRSHSGCQVSQQLWGALPALGHAC